VKGKNEPIELVNKSYQEIDDGLNQAIAKTKKFAEQQDEKGDKIKTKIVVFVYYAGHGLLDSKGDTYIMTIKDQDKDYNLDVKLRELEHNPNTVVIGVLDCCRKGDGKEDDILEDLQIVPSISKGDSKLAG